MTNLTRAFQSEYDPAMDLSFNGILCIQNLKTYSPFGFNIVNNKVGFNNTWIAGRPGVTRYTLYSPFEFLTHKIYKDDTIEMTSKYGFSVRVKKVTEDLSTSKDLKRNSIVAESGGVVRVGDEFILGAVVVSLVQRKKNDMLSDLFSESYSCSPNLDDNTILKNFCICNGIDPTSGEQNLKKFREKNEVRFLNRYSIRMYDPYTNDIATFFNWKSLF